MPISEEIYQKLVCWYGGPAIPFVRYTDNEKGSLRPVIIYYPAILRVLFLILSIRYILEPILFYQK